MMNIFNIKNLLFAAMILLASSSFTSCGSSDETSMPQQIKQYFDKDITLKNAGNHTSAYFDLSDGVVLAYKNKDAASFLNATVQKLTSNDSCQVFSLADDKITPLNLKQTKLYNKIMDTGSYVQQMAPIEKTLDKIVRDGKSSLLVTDFEEFTPDRQVQHQSFATRYFTNWLKQGNDITFFVFDFIGERNIPYHLYFIVFDNKSHQFLNNIKESGIAFVPTNGSMKAQIDTIAEDKGYIDKLAHMSGFLLTTFNTMHQQGAGIDGTDSSFGNDDGTDSYKGPSYGVNYWGDDNTLYTWDATNEVVKAVELKDIKRTVEVDDTQTDVSGNTIRTPKVTIGGTQVSETTLDGINIINALAVNTAIKETGGQNLIAARKLVVEQNVSDTGALENGYSVKVNGSGDGTNATNIATLINMDQANVHSTSYIVYNATTTGGTTKLMDMADDTMTTDNMKYRALDVDSLNAYYSAAVSKLGSDSESVDDKSDAQDQLIEQITNWRSSTSGVDWNEELSNMIMFQKGYSACSRCLTTMDEMLDRLINSTGTVGR